MLSLAELQRSIRETIHTGAMVKDLKCEIVSTELNAADRLQIYQNNFREPLAQSLLEVFPIVSAFVGEVFTRTALRHFIKWEPPIEPCLSNYGKTLGVFLKSYAPADSVPYLSDLADLEWAIHELQHVAEKVAVDDPGLAFKTNFVFIESRFPLLNLWMVGNGQLRAEAVHIDQGGQFVCIALSEMRVQLFALSEKEKMAVTDFKNGKVVGDTEVIRSLSEKGILVTK